jgi:SAM-dependent methyltransferase
VSEAMEAEFDTVAEWTAQVATDLGPEYHVPAGCRGSGSPAALDWLIEQMELAPGDTLLDSGAGVGGPAAYAARKRLVSPLLVEPEAGACRAALQLFGYPVLRADGSALPVKDATFDAAWSLGVLCTTPDQVALLHELRRVIRPGGRIGLLAFVARRELPADRTEGNHFPTPDRLRDLMQRCALHTEHWMSTTDLPPIPEEWNTRVDTVTKALADRYEHTDAWQMAERQSSGIGSLLKDGAVTGELLVLSQA